MFKRFATSVARALAGAAVVALPAAPMLAGCGQKGPLTLPAKPAAASSAASSAGTR
jgi:predicted small lipoprotein YifL